MLKDGNWALGPLSPKTPSDTISSMKLTKYEHAALDLDQDSQRLLIDPGTLSPSLTDFNNIVGVVITHVHQDHLDEAKLAAVKKQNPEVQIFSTQEVADHLGKTCPVTVVQPGQSYTVGTFNLEFFGHDHAVIDPKTPVAQNTGVLVNDNLYYPGDSFTPCPKPLKILATPSSGPWLKIGEVAPLIEETNCQIIFPTHNGLLSGIGEDAANRWLKIFAERSGKQLKILAVGESLETT